ncbi:MAG: hypothetical protein WC718_13700 [Phycisphaerales bacterium]|jgi:hypothetical protein
MRTAFVLGAIAAITSVASATVSYSDGTFSLSGANSWAVETLGQGSASASQSASGNPGTARQVNLTTGGNGGDTIWAFSRFGSTTATRYEPANQGAILSLSWTIDARLTQGGGDGQALWLALKQGQLIYVADAHVTGSSGQWNTFGGSGILAADFARLDGQSGTPDFSVAGAPIRFGFVNGNSTTGGSYSTAALYDNWSVTVNTVPAPATCLLAGSLVMAGRRRRA